VYAFIKHPIPLHLDDQNRVVETLTCVHGCGFPYPRNMDTSNAGSTGNLREHFKKCFNPVLIAQVNGMSKPAAARKKLVVPHLRDGQIANHFQVKDTTKKTYLANPMTKYENKDYLDQMLTGRPHMEKDIPSARTVGRNVRQVFHLVQDRLKGILAYPGLIHFSLDVWSSPNQRVYLAFVVYRIWKNE
ncbi:hypothetical protein BDV98DRAFT_514550, partial [Pterulicium gracile]